MFAGKNVYSPRRAKKKGVQDGRPWRWRFGWPLKEEKDSYPPENSQVLPEYENQLYRVAESDLHKLAEEWNKKDKPLREACADTQNDYLKLKREIEEKYGMQAKVARDYERAKTRFESFEQPAWSKWLHWPILLVIFGGEAVMNWTIFQIFLENRFNTFIMAIALIITIPVCGELFGQSLRHEKKNKTDRILMYACLFIMIAVLVGVSYLRLEYFWAGGAKEILGINIGRIPFFLCFLFFNFIFFFVATWLAYLITHKNPEAFASAKKQYEEAKQKLGQEKSELQQITEKLALVRKNFDRNHISRTREFAGFQERAERIVKNIMTHVSIYRDNNIQARGKGSKKPPCFDTEPEDKIVVPPSLVDLDCEPCIYSQLQELDERIADLENLPPVAAVLPSPAEAIQAGEKVAIPFLFTESSKPEAAKALFEAFVTKTGLQDTAQNVQNVLSGNDLFVFLEGVSNPRQSQKPDDWKKAWSKLLNNWVELDKKLIKVFPQGWTYHLYPHGVLPLSFALGASVGLRRPMVVYHEQAGRFFKVLELPDPRVLVKKPPSSAPEPEIKKSEERNTASPEDVSSRLILHIFISDRHTFSFKIHPGEKAADSKALLYLQALPEGDWLGYLQHLVSKATEMIKDYEEVELCLLCPAAVAFALGMAFSRTPKLTVCQWFTNETPALYKPVFSLNKVEEQISKGIFS